MDIEKERELFEIEFSKIKSDISFWVNTWDEDMQGYNHPVMCWIWHIWQAAKAQSDKKIKLLLCGEHLQKCESPTGIFNSQYPNEEPCLICLAKQAKAQAVPEGFVLVEKKNIENWYFDDSEYMWMEEPDNWLCDLDIGEVQEVERKEYIVTDNSSLFATRVWDDENDQADCWEFFRTKEEAEKAAAYCKAKFNDEPVEAQEPAND